MSLIIDISDKMFDTFKKHGIMAFDHLDEYDKDQLAVAIANGISYNPTDKNDCEGCCHYTCDGDIPYCELGHSIQKRCKKFSVADMRGAE